MTKTKKFLLLAYLFVLFHTVKDFFQDFLETDFLYFFAVLSIDLLLDPRITNPKLFFDKSTRTPASEFKKTYSGIIRQSQF